VEKPAGGHYARGEEVVRRLRAAGYEALFAGGCVRDLLMGREPADYDIATSARPGEVEELFERTVPVGRDFGVSLVLVEGDTYEVAAFRQESGYSDGRHPDRVSFSGPEQDAQRRDFTVNALLWDPVENRVLDFVGGRRDLEARVIRAVGDPRVRFREDHLRLIRAVRFASRLDFELEPGTLSAARELAGLCVQVSAERLQQELRVVLTDRDPAGALRLMERLGMLFCVFPELADTQGCEQPENYHPEGDVYVHTVLTVEKLGPHPEFELSMAALLHDIGKPPASRRAGPRHFPDHCQIGGEMAWKVCRRLRLSNDETDRICWLVRRHLYFKDAKQMRRSTLKRLFAEPGFAQLAELHRADALASWGNLTDYNYVMRQRATMPPEEAAPPPLITGDDLVAMGYEPGPLFGKVLEAVRDAQLDGEVATPQQARTLARSVADRCSRR
jgi:tRNA nucleotidyltransferase/poly(A) polymerase